MRNLATNHSMRDKSGLDPFLAATSIADAIIGAVSRPKAQELSRPEGRDFAANFLMGWGPLCKSEGECDGRVYVCMRTAGHLGIHVSHDSDGEASAFWEGK